jgi:hypothetical protein
MKSLFINLFIIYYDGFVFWDFYSFIYLSAMYDRDVTGKTTRKERDSRPLVARRLQLVTSIQHSEGDSSLPPHRASPLPWVPGY